MILTGRQKGSEATAVILFLRIPMAIALLVSTIIGMVGFGITDIVYVGKATFESLYFFTTIIPLYIFAGILMSRGGIAKQLCDFCYTLVAKITGSPGHGLRFPVDVGVVAPPSGLSKRYIGKE